MQHLPPESRHKRAYLPLDFLPYFVLFVLAGFSFLNSVVSCYYNVYSQLAFTSFLTYISACIYKLQGLKADNDCKDIYFFYKKTVFRIFFFRIDEDFIKNVIKPRFLGGSPKT